MTAPPHPSPRFRVVFHLAAALGLTSFLACSGPPAAGSVTPPPPRPSGSPTISAPRPEVVNLPALLLTSERESVSPFFTEKDALVFSGPLGIHRLDPSTGIERVIVRSAASRWDVPYSSARFLLLRIDEPFQLDLLDTDTLSRRTVPVSSGTFDMSHDEKRLLWQPSEGPATLFDTATASALHTFPPNALGRGIPRLSQDGRFAFVNGALYEIATDRVIWTTKGEPASVSFPTVDGEVVLLAARTQSIELVELPSGTSHRADADCLDAQRPRRQLVGSNQHPWFVRGCPRGILAVHLPTLRRSSVPLLKPTRARGVVRELFTASGTLVVTNAVPGETKGRWFEIDPSGKAPKRLATPPAEASAPPEPFVSSSSTDGTQRVEGAPGTCQLVSGTVSRPVPGGCEKVAVSPSGRYVAQLASPALIIRKISSLEPVYQSDPHGVLDRDLEVETSLDEVHRSIKVIRKRRGTSDAEATTFTIERTDALTLGGDAPPNEASRGADAGTEEEERGEFYAEMHPLQGTIDGAEVRVEARMQNLQLWTFTESESGKRLMTLTLGPDFGIFESKTRGVQIVGDRAHAANWLRCLEPEGVLRPFETCAARASTTLF